jgi:hypothetical protein
MAVFWDAAPCNLVEVDLKLTVFEFDPKPTNVRVFVDLFNPLKIPIQNLK